MNAVNRASQRRRGFLSRQTKSQKESSKEEPVVPKEVTDMTFNDNDQDKKNESSKAFSRNQTPPKLHPVATSPTGKPHTKEGSPCRAIRGRSYGKNHKPAESGPWWGEVPTSHEALGFIIGLADMDSMLTAIRNGSVEGLPREGSVWEFPTPPLSGRWKMERLTDRGERLWRRRLNGFDWSKQRWSLCHEAHTDCWEQLEHQVLDGTIMCKKGLPENKCIGSLSVISFPGFDSYGDASKNSQGLATQHLRGLQSSPVQPVVLGDDLSFTIVGGFNHQKYKLHMYTKESKLVALQVHFRSPYDVESSSSATKMTMKNLAKHGPAKTPPKMDLLLNRASSNKRKPFSDDSNPTPSKKSCSTSSDDLQLDEKSIAVSSEHRVSSIRDFYLKTKTTSQGSCSELSSSLAHSTSPARTNKSTENRKLTTTVPSTIEEGQELQHDPSVVVDRNVGPGRLRVDSKLKKTGIRTSTSSQLCPPSESSGHFDVDLREEKVYEPPPGTTSGHSSDSSTLAPPVQPTAPCKAIATPKNVPHKRYRCSKVRSCRASKRYNRGIVHDGDKNNRNTPIDFGSELLQILGSNDTCRSGSPMTYDQPKTKVKIQMPSNEEDTLDLWNSDDEACDVCPNDFEDAQEFPAKVQSKQGTQGYNDDNEMTLEEIRAFDLEGICTVDSDLQLTLWAESDPPETWVQWAKEKVVVLLFWSVLLVILHVGRVDDLIYDGLEMGRKEPTSNAWTWMPLRMN